MSTDIKNKKLKIGARPLSESEISLILPTYNKIKQQIDDMRIAKISKENGKSNVSLKGEQKTNNIGILGARGTGKTSVLKTIQEYLSEDKNMLDENKKMKNILLPMIVPENMSESMNLMSSILGLFKREVDAIAKKTEKEKLCWEEKSTPVEKQYNDLIKKYCYIQNEFRNIIVHEYTTESDYVKKSSEIFNSDYDFLYKFNEFINLLLDNEIYADDAMIFLFVDDIDLSTHRCTDVVKTLLSFISHPRIITFISGDLNTFEEALTLDFLRQEKSLSGDLLDKNFVQISNDENMLLQRKNLLAYEYLKKVLPPIYRHTVKNWSLADRGNYQVTTEEDSKEGGIKLASLLSDTFYHYHCEAYFQYYEEVKVEKEEKQENKEEKPKYEKKNVQQVFHIFDSTARGLNNVYNTLLEYQEDIQCLDTEKSEDKESKKKNIARAFTAVKLFLETLVASHRVLSNHRDMLFQHVIQFGSDFDTTIIRCDNMYSYLYIDKIDKEKTFQIEDHVERFSLFVFLDFSLRALRKTNQFLSDDYDKLKKRAVLDLLQYPIISGNTATISLHGGTERIYDYCNIADTNKTIYEYDKFKWLFFSSEFVFTMHYIQFVRDVEPDDLYRCCFNYSNAIVELTERLYILSFKALDSLKKRHNNDMEILLVNYMKAIQILSFYNHYSGGENTFILSKIFRSVVEKCFEKVKIEGIGTHEEISNLVKVKENLKVHDYLIYNFLSKHLDIIFTDNKLKDFSSMIEEMKEKNNDISSKQYVIIEKIDKYKMWNDEVSDPVKKFVEEKIENFFIEELFSDLVNITVDIKMVKDYYKEIRNLSYGSGSYKTGFDKLRDNLNFKLKAVYADGEACSEIKLLDYGACVGHPYEIIFANEEAKAMTIYGFKKNNRLRYGKLEVAKLASLCKSSALTISTKVENILKRNVFWFYCYALMELSTRDFTELRKQSSDSAKLSNLLDKLNETEAIKSNEEITKIFDLQEISDCFSLKKGTDENGK